MGDLIQKIIERAPEVITGLAGLTAALSVLAKITKSDKDDKIIARLSNWLASAMVLFTRTPRHLESKKS